jgi:hypothetical protein
LTCISEEVEEKSAEALAPRWVNDLIEEKLFDRRNYSATFPPCSWTPRACRFTARRRDARRAPLFARTSGPT